MSTSRFWTRPARVLSQSLVLLAGLLALDELGHIFVPHRPVYWIGLVLFVLLVVVWDSVIPIQAKPGSETRRTIFFRFFFQAIVLLVTLIVLDRTVDRIFTTGNGVVFWICFGLALVVLSGWHVVALSRIGQRVLASVAVERVAFVLCSLIGALVALELFVESDFSRHHVFGIWPTWEITTDHRIRFELNAAGYRDIDHPVEKQPGVTRILLIGDSVTAGYGVPQTDYYPVLLRQAAGPSFEFIVVAQPASETVHEVNLLQSYGCQFAPDVVIVGAFSNDPYLGLEKNTPPWPPYRSYFKQLESPYSFNPDLIYMLDGTIHGIAGSFGEYSYDDWLTALYDPAEPWIDLWHPVVRQLGDLATECGAKRLYAYTLPEPADYSNPEIFEKFERIHNTLADGFTQAGFETTNLFPAYVERFEGVPFRALWAIPNDPHPNAEIHRWYAEQIWDSLAPMLASGE
ncbi:MAG: SGNH/GDSL hydrolase family protein [Anaerolineae bacterium]|nr:SGNH/GDSL hydrolase family protein [Anaerolineae bacterium]